MNESIFKSRVNERKHIAVYEDSTLHPQDCTSTKNFLGVFVFSFFFMFCTARAQCTFLRKSLHGGSRRSQCLGSRLFVLHKMSLMGF